MNLLSSIMKPPTSIPLPGDGSVWKTPRNSSPEFEFGDGISAVFKSLSVATTSTASKPGQDRGHSRHVLSANTAPFVPSLQQTGPSIPIPLPSMANGQQAASIHINNFTANLNYQGGNLQPPPLPTLATIWQVQVIMKASLVIILPMVRLWSSCLSLPGFHFPPIPSLTLWPNRLQPHSSSL